jgi:thiamine-phosphate pyrophosphorylase
MKGVYLVTDRGLLMNNSLEDVVHAAVKAGACCVQLREKDISTREFLDVAKRLKKLMTPYEVPLVINDRVDIAMAIDADGIHIGMSDMPYETAREMMKPDAIIGLSVETWEDVESAQKLDVDYIGVSPVFSTPTKTDTKTPWGLDGLAKIKTYSKHPLVAIGGINLSNIESVLKAGADSVAVVSAICSADDPYASASLLAKYFSSKD